MPSKRFKASLGRSHHRPPYPFKAAKVVAGSLTDIHNAMVKCLFTINKSSLYKRDLSGPTSKNPEDLNLASVQAMQLVLFYLSIGHDRCR
jgi:hypothetical protein